MSQNDSSDKKAGPTGCPASLNILGEHFDCDWPTTDAEGRHDGWAHSNKAAQALWTDDRNTFPAESLDGAA